MTVTQKDVEKYYDKHSVGKLSDFVYGNGRIETAWKTILEWGGTPATHPGSRVRGRRDQLADGNDVARRKCFRD